MTEEPEGWGLVMPFVCVTSAGGPYDDDAFTAGFQIGTLDATLATTPARSMVVLIRRDLMKQADLTAMSYGWSMTEATDVTFDDDAPQEVIDEAAVLIFVKPANPGLDR